MIYLDYNASHPPDKAAVLEATEIYLQHFGNTSGRSGLSQTAARLLAYHREQLAQKLSLNADRVILTGSASEANAIVVKMILQEAKETGQKLLLLHTQLEHPSVIENMRLAQKSDSENVDLKIISLDEKLQPDLQDINNSIREHNGIVLLAIMHAHNETGLLWPLDQNCEAFRENKNVYLLADASQSIAKMHPAGTPAIPSNFFSTIYNKRLFISIAGHKFGAGLGGGLLVLPQDDLSAKREVLRLYGGGNQEQSLRPGTVNLQAMVSMNLALQNRFQRNNFITIIQENTRLFEKMLGEKFSQVAEFEIVAAEYKRLPGTTLVLIPGVSIDFLLMGLDRAEIVVSTGTSCKSNSRTASPGLLAMGYDEEKALSVIRFSYGEQFTDKIISKTVNTVFDVYKKLV